jgi:hypothetical protein
MAKSRTGFGRGTPELAIEKNSTLRWIQQLAVRHLKLLAQLEENRYTKEGVLRSASRCYCVGTRGSFLFRFWKYTNRTKQKLATSDERTKQWYERNGPNRGNTSSSFIIRYRYRLGQWPARCCVIANIVESLFRPALAKHAPAPHLPSSYRFSSLLADICCPRHPPRRPVLAHLPLSHTCSTTSVARQCTSLSLSLVSHSRQPVNMLRIMPADLIVSRGSSWSCGAR